MGRFDNNLNVTSTNIPFAARKAREEGGRGTRSCPPFSLALGLAPKFPSLPLSNACHAGKR